jgi:hypothetical protein
MTGYTGEENRDSSFVYTLSPTSLTQSPAEESVVYLNSGGSFFVLQSPFVITAGDIANQTRFKLQLLLNEPQSLIQGYRGSVVNAAAKSPYANLFDLSSNAMYAPIMSVIRKGKLSRKACLVTLLLKYYF